MLSIEEISKFINEDSQSRKKRIASIGQRYYEGEHDIKNYKLYYYNADGQLVEDKSRSNIKISHPFFTELCDQCAQYMLSGKDAFIKSDNPALQDELNRYFYDDENFLAELYNLLIGSMSKGFEYMFAYKNADGRLAFECADSIGVIEVRAKDTDANADHVIYWYYDRIAKSNDKIKRIRVFDEKETSFFVQKNNGKIEPDADEEINPKPNYVFEEDGERMGSSLGFVPFFRLDYCQKQTSALSPVKEIIDDYDLMSCGLSNNIQDASEYVVVVKGFQGDNLDELQQNIKTKKTIGVDEGGDVDFKTVSIPYDARKTKLELDEKNIYRFGMGFNSAQMGDGNITNIVIKSRYALLDLKCNKLEIRLKQFLRKIIKLVLDEINSENETDYQMKDVYFDFTREVMTNAADNATIAKTDAETEQIKINTLLNLANSLDEETIIQSVCEVLDINYEDIKNRLPKNDIYDNEEAQNLIDGV